MADRPRHVEASLLGRRAGPPGPAAQSRGPLELCDQSIPLGDSLRPPPGITLDYGIVQVVVQLSETPPVLPERFSIKQRTSVAARNRHLTRCPDERQGGYELMRSTDELAEVPEPF
jgi:hypothetical protein